MYSEGKEIQVLGGVWLYNSLCWRDCASSRNVNVYEFLMRQAVLNRNCYGFADKIATK